MILTACILASASYFAAASAPWFGAWSVTVLITAILCFALSLTGFIAGWFPLLDTFLTRERRTGFFCSMRFCHQLTATLFLFAVGAAIGGQPSAGTLQGVLFLAAIIFTGRAAAIARIPDFRIPERGTAGFRTGLARAIGNKALTGFSTYLFVLNLAAFGTVPLMILCLKNQLGAPDNVIVFISGAALSGMLAGYLCAGKLLRLAGPRRFYPLFHALFFAVNFMLFFIGRGGAAACPGHRGPALPVQSRHRRRLNRGFGRNDGARLPRQQGHGDGALRSVLLRRAPGCRDSSPRCCSAEKCSRRSGCSER